MPFPCNTHISNPDWKSLGFFEPFSHQLVDFFGQKQIHKQTKLASKRKKFFCSFSKILGDDQSKSKAPQNGEP
jgi:hypothetical protein